MTDRQPFTPATVVLFAAIVLGFLLEIYTGAWKNGDLLAELGAIVPARVFEDGDYWRLVSAMFLHGDGTVRGDLLHLGFNLFALWQLGRLYEMMFGTKRFLFVYFVTGLIASVASLLHLPPYGASVGASGAIFGVIGAFIFSIRRSPRFRHERWARGIVQQLMFWIVANIAIGLSFPQIDLAAHIGGLIAGLILGALLPNGAPASPPADVGGVSPPPPV
jgi:rhomboid protease GluP